MKLAKKKKQLDDSGAHVLVIGFEEAADLKEIKERLKSPFQFLVDPNKTTYEAYGLGRASNARISLDPRVLAKGITTTLAGSFWRPRPGQDRNQLSGDFVVDGSGTLVLAHPQKGPEDRLPVGKIIEAVNAVASP